MLLARNLPKKQRQSKGKRGSHTNPSLLLPSAPARERGRWKSLLSLGKVLE